MASSRVFLIICLAVLPLIGLGQLTPAERKGLDDALYIGNLVEQDLRYEKKVTNDIYRLPLSQLALDNPLEAADRLLSLHQSANQPLSRILANGCEQVFGEKVVAPSEPPILGPLPADVPSELSESVEILLGAIDESNRTVHEAISKLTAGEKRELIEGLPTLCANSKQVKFGFTKIDAASRERMLELLAKVDLVKMRAASVQLSGVVEGQLPALKALSKTLHLDRSLRFVTHGYRVEISTESNAIQTSRDTNLFLGFGDRNRFTGRFGAGIGYSSVLLDFGDGSYYDVPDLSVGSGLLGIGLAYVTGNGDVFRGGSVCFGSGLAGVGGMAHVGTDPSYRAISLSEGYGAFGIGVLDEAGDRSHLAVELYGQGSARTQGLGWLIATGSDDSISAGGLLSVDSRNSTLAGAQGYSSGFGTEDEFISGGAGLVTTFGKDVNYVAGIRSQGSAILGGIGSIDDQGERGSHQAIQESQGYANHQAAAYVFNSGGYNSYTCSVGTGQGCASDYSVAFVLDRAGHDLYSAKDCRPATALSNGLSLFLNVGSESTFDGQPAYAVPSHSTPSLGLFCDLGANTSYSSTAGFAPLKVDQNLAVFYQAETSTGESIDLGSREQRFHTAAQLNPGETQMGILWDRAKGHSPEALAARQQLIAIGAPSAEYIYRQELREWHSADSAAISEVISGIGDDARKILCLEIDSSNPVRQINALRIAALAPGKGMDASIKRALGQAVLAKWAARAAGLSRIKSVVPELVALTASSDSTVALSALVALKEIGDPAGAKPASALLTTGQWPIRRAAISLLAQFPDQAIATAYTLLATGSDQEKRTGVQVLVAMNSEDSYRRIGHLLGNPSPGVALEALLGLQGHITPELRGQVSAFQTGPMGPNVLLKRVAEGIQADR